MIVAGITALATLGVGWLAHGARKFGKQAAEDAACAVENTNGADEPMQEIRATLGEILVTATEARDEATKAHEKIDEHLAAHANAHIYQLPVARTAGERR